jgi:hypothetical protein
MTKAPKTVLKLALALAALAAPSAALAENWFPFFMIPAGVVYLDKDSVVRRNGHVIARTEATYPEPQQLKRAGRTYAYVKAINLIDLDCSRLVYMYEGRDLYSSLGVLIVSINEGDNPIPVVAKTVESALSAAYCH